ncbi:DNA primase [soil metagenome]
MGIVDEDVVRVREASDLVAIVTQYLGLKRVGRRHQGLCPFHAEKTASFSVNGEEGLWYCFGCQAKGDVITFVREMEHLDFVGAVEWLAAKCGIQLRYTDAGATEHRKRRSRLVDALGAAVEWYHQRLLTAPDAATARAYLRSRGFDGDQVRAYRLGWAPEGWDTLTKALRLPDEIVRDTGLGFLNRYGRQTDAFRARVLFPIFDAQGDPVAFGGRNLPDGEGPKYKNSPETPLYAKSKVLYGLNWAKAAVVAADEVIVCEGYTDVIGFATAGLPRAVATCGTALTEEHVRQLKRFASRVVLAFDPDAAGQAAAARFYEWERAHEVDVAVAALPAGEDPADLARHDPERLALAVADAVPFLGFRVGRVLGGANLSTPEGRARAAETALAVVAEHPSDLVRDQYVMEIADRCRLDPDRVRAGQLTGGPSAPGPRVAQGPTGRGDDGPEVQALRLAVHRRAEMVPLLDDVLFGDERHRAAFRAVADTADLHQALAAADPGAAELLGRVAVEDTEAEPDDVFRRLLREGGRRALAELEDAARHHADPLAFSPLVGWLKVQIEQVEADAPPNRDTETQLLAWLRQRAGEEA